MREERSNLRQPQRRQIQLATRPGAIVTASAKPVIAQQPATPSAPTPVSYATVPHVQSSATHGSHNQIQAKPMFKASNHILKKSPYIDSMSSPIRPIVSKQKQHTPSAIAASPKPASRPKQRVRTGEALSSAQRFVPKEPPAKPLFEQYINNHKAANPKKKSRKAQFAFVTAGVLVFVIGITVSIMGMKANTQVAAQAQVLSQTTSAVANGDSGGGDESLDESPVHESAIAAYKAAPDVPRKIMIPKLKASARIMPMGVKANNELNAPSNIYDAGWYSSSAKLGEDGATLIDGHYSGITKQGIFNGLEKLNDGDKIQVERGDGKLFTYTVARKQAYDAQATDMTAAMTPADGSKSGLNLITCHGKYNKTTKTYDQRLIVFTTHD